MTQPNSTPPLIEPLRFEPIYKEKVWGGRGFEKLGRELPGDAATGIGESWELADLATTSASGGGGNAEHSIVSTGDYQGTGIRELMRQFGSELLGRGICPSYDGGFPLLIKFLDANDNLSVQVHPSPSYAADLPDAHLKSEAWYIVDAKPGAVIYKGLTPGTTAQQLRDAIRTNTDAAMLPLMQAIPAIPGDCHYLPSGTLHALGAGVLVAEVQTPSDTTFRVYDWGRTDRELHIEQAMACIDFESTNTPRSVTDQSTPSPFFVTKAACDFFTIQQFATTAPCQAAVAPMGCEIWIGLDGIIQIGAASSGASDRASATIAVGQTVLLPANMGELDIAAAGRASCLRVTLPASA